MADRLAYLARDGGTEHLVERDGDRYRLTEEKKAIRSSVGENTRRI